MNETNYFADGVFLNSKGEVVYGKDPDRKVQLVAPGGYADAALIKRYNLKAPEQKAVETAPQNKAVTMPTKGTK